MKLLKLNNLLVVTLFLSVSTMAQVKTETTKTQGQPSVQTMVERGEVVDVSGNDVVVKMENGEIRNFPNVPESARITVDGQQLSVHDLKPGMKLERTITTTSTPQTVTTVKTVTGTIFHVSPPSSVILTLEDGSNQQFTIPKGQKFNVNGQETDAFHLRKGMRVSATQMVTEPVNVVSQSQKVTGEMPPPPPTEAIQGPLLIVKVRPRSAEVAQNQPAPNQPAPSKLPQTASMLPFMALFGTLLVLSGVVLVAMRLRAD